MNSNSKEFPISEIFTSPQGEGVWSGTMMTFVRLAGCTVGKPYPKDKYQTFQGEGKINGNALPIYTEECTLYDGRKFPCDTDYRKKKVMTAAQILEEIPKNVTHVCITGGEPLMHDLYSLVKPLRLANKEIHLETSGTKRPKSMVELENIWVTVSPKKPLLPEMVLRANEFKILVDDQFDPDLKVCQGPDTWASWAEIAKLGVVVWLQPVNFEHEVNPDNVKLCMKWMEKYPQFRVSLQMHKVLSLFTEERIR